MLPEPSSKPTYAYNIFTKTHTAFPKTAADHEDTSVRKTGRHVRTGSDGVKPSKAGLRSKPNEKNIPDQKAPKQSKTGDQSPTQLSTPSRQIDPSSELNGDKESSLQP